MFLRKTCLELNCHGQNKTRQGKVCFCFLFFSFKFPIGAARRNMSYGAVD